MKKMILLISMIFIFSSSIYCSEALAKGKTQFNAGAGFSSWGVPIYVGLDFGVNRNITLGGELSFQRYNDHHYDHSIMGLSGNANYHFNNVLKIPSNWDFYVGLSIGYFYWQSSDDYDGSHTSGLGISGQIGGRYYFSKNFGINLEFGGGSAFSGGKIGISLIL